MNTANGYRRYPELVKHEVARSRNIYLFPDLKIPRTTAANHGHGIPSQILFLELKQAI